VAKGVAGVVVITAGFSEAGRRGPPAKAPDRQGARGGNPTHRAQLHGLVNTDPEIRLDATFAPVYPPEAASRSPRRAALWGSRSSISPESSTSGSRDFVSIAADVSGNDLIQYWSEDPAPT
jgi:hypothetical protein